MPITAAALSRAVLLVKGVLGVSSSNILLAYSTGVSTLGVVMYGIGVWSLSSDESKESYLFPARYSSVGSLSLVFPSSVFTWVSAEFPVFCLAVLDPLWFFGAFLLIFPPG